MVVSVGAAHAQANPGSARLAGPGFLMGGTGVALGNQSTVALINPARMTRVEAGSFFISRFIFSRINTSSDFFAPRAAWDAENVGTSVMDIDLLLGGVCFTDDFGTAAAAPRDEWGTTGHAGRHHVGVCVVVDQKEDILATARQPESTPLRVSGSLVQRWVRRQIGAGWGWDVTDEISVGASTLVSIANYREATFGSSVEPIAAPVLRTAQLDAVGTSFDVSAHLGLSYRFGRHVTLGLAARLPSIHVAGSWARTSFSAESGGGFSRASEFGSFRAPIPARVSFGAGFHTEDVRGEVDLSAHLPLAGLLEVNNERVSSDAIGAPDSSPPHGRRERGRARVLLGGGLEWRVLRQVGLMTGFSVDPSLFDSLTTAAPDRLAFRRVDRIHASGGLSLYGPAGRLIVGSRLTYGFGELRVADSLSSPPGPAVADHEEFAALVHIGGRIELEQLTGLRGGLRGLFSLGDDDEAN
ncbi:MAG: hypothetical protein AAGA56_21340 [Myxococcota bacterium]